VARFSHWVSLSTAESEMMGRSAGTCELWLEVDRLRRWLKLRVSRKRLALLPVRGRPDVGE